MTTKGKSKTNSLAELHFLSSLQLEQSAMLLGDIADEDHRVTLTEISPHEFKFQIEYVLRNARVAAISGTLQRWNGTETKIDADGEVLRLESPDSATKSAGGVASAIFLTFMGIGIAATFGQSWLLPLIISGGITYSYLSVAGGDKESQTVLFRHRDYLLQRLIDAFKSAGEVEAI